MAITSSVSGFLGKIQQGVKPNLFLVDINFPGNHPDSPKGEEKDLVDILCKSAALPGSNLGVIDVPFRGRTVKIAGDRTFDTWTVTFLNDADFKVRGYMERWLQAINAHEGNYSDLFVPDSTEGYFADLKVKQLERDESSSILREYTIYGAFPTSVSQIDLAYDSNDQIEEFTVEFQLQYWKVESGDLTVAN